MSGSYEKKTTENDDLEEDFEDFEDLEELGEYEEDYGEDDELDEPEHYHFHEGQNDELGIAMPNGPIWHEGQLLVPPDWEGQFSDMNFSMESSPSGYILHVEISGEYGSTLSTMCSHPEGFMDTYLGLDLALAIAADPSSLPPDVIAENALAVGHATMIMGFGADKIAGSLDNVFKPPERHHQYEAQLKANIEASANIRRAIARVNGTLRDILDPQLLASIRVEDPDQYTLH